VRPQPERSDGELLSEVSDDPSAFMEIFERHFTSVHRFIARQIGASAAEDATAEVFVRALRGAGSFTSDTGDARPWLLGIAANVVRVELRRRYQCQPQPIEAADREATRSMDESGLEAVGHLAEVEKALETISIEDREPLLLYAWLDLSYEEIAMALGIPVGTVRSRIARARRCLRAQLGMEQLQAVSEGTHDG
jgi:RNA polymerase sigma-70 factor (ECF subfamily)